MLSSENEASTVETSREENDMTEPALPPQPEEKEANPEFKALLGKLQGEADPEKKLQILIEFLENALSQSGTPHFRNFWEARKLSLDLFPQVSNPSVRSQLWSKYSELSKEARRLKELLDEESVFFVEQIEIAITQLEKDCKDLNEALEKASKPGFPPVESLKKDLEYYQNTQNELNLLNAYAARINALRKELIKTEMRIRQKNRFFSRLSHVGDLVFPRRKTLIDEISARFKEDVSQFVKVYFKGSKKENPFFLRDEIKGLQGSAKIITLSTSAFKETRLQLSECWDTLKAEDDEHKKFKKQQKEAFKVNFQALNEQLDEMMKRFQEGSLGKGALDKEIEAFQNEMRARELGRDEIKALRDKARALYDLQHEQERKESEARDAHERLKSQERKEKLLNFKNQILELIENASKLEMEEFQAKKDELLELSQTFHFSRQEKQEIDKSLKALKEIMVEKGEKRMLELPENERQAIEQLNQVLTQRKERRQEIKQQLDDLKKLAGGSNLDFEKAIKLNEQIKEEKERLEKCQFSVKEIEERLAEFHQA